MMMMNQRHVINNNNSSNNNTRARRLSAPVAAVVVSVACAGAGGAAAIAQEYSITNLGILPGDDESYATDINERGQVVGWSEDGGVDNSEEAFLWRNGAMEGLGTLGGLNSSAQGINDATVVTGVARIASQSQRGFEWSSGVMIDLGTLPTGVSSFGSDINDSGLIVGGADKDFGFFDFRTQPASFDSGAVNELGLLPDEGTFGAAEGVNEDGVAVGWCQVVLGFFDINTHGVLWRDDQIIELFTLGGRNSQARAVNDFDEIVGFAELGGPNRPRRAALWLPGSQTPIDLGSDGFSASDANDINNAGMIVGSKQTLGDLRAVIWDPVNLMRDLNTLIPNGSGWTLRDAAAVNDRGQIVGWGEFNGVVRAFLLTPRYPDGAILVNGTSDGRTYVLDARTGAPRGSFPTRDQINGYRVIDGNDGGLLMSDRNADTIWRLARDGVVLGEFLQSAAPADLRGVARSIGGFIVGATSDGLLAWDANGAISPLSAPGNMFDVILVELPARKFYVASDIGRDNLRAYSIEAAFLGETQPGGVGNPQQVTRLQSGRLAVAGFGDSRVSIFRLNGSLESSFATQGRAIGVIDAGNGDLLVTTDTGLDLHSVNGAFVRRIMTRDGLRFLSLCRNYRFE